MRLAFFSFKSPYGSSPHGGAETSLRLLARKFAAAGHDVVFIAVQTAPDEVALAMTEGVRLVPLPRISRKPRNEPRGIVKWHAALQLRRVLARERTELLYMFYELSYVEAALLARTGLKGPKIVMRMAGLRWYERSVQKPAVERRYRQAFAKVDMVNYISQGVKDLCLDRFAELGWPRLEQPSFVGDIGSSAAIGKRPATTGQDSGPFRMAMVARFSDYQKRQDLLVRAMSLVPPERDVALLLVGEGLMLPKIRSLVDDLGQQHRITFRPFMPQDDLWKELQSTQLLCLCTDYEGVGKIVVEAMAMGLPCLVSDVPPLRDMIRNGQNGFLAANTPEDWARVISDLAAHPERARAVQAAAIETAAREFDPDMNLALFERAFESLLHHDVRKAG